MINPNIIGALAGIKRLQLVPARYFRLTITKFKYNGTDNPAGTSGDVRISELQLFVGATKYPTSAMTGPSSPSPLVASASTTSGSFPPYEAFNNVTGDSSRWISTTSGAPQWLQIDLGAGNEILPDSVKIAPDGAVSIGGGYFPVDFKIEGSNTGLFTGEQQTFYSATGLDTGWANNTLRTFTF